MGAAEQKEIDFCFRSKNEVTRGRRSDFFTPCLIFSFWLTKSAHRATRGPTANSKEKTPLPSKAGGFLLLWIVQEEISQGHQQYETQPQRKIGFIGHTGYKVKHYRPLMMSYIEGFLGFLAGTRLKVWRKSDLISTKVMGSVLVPMGLAVLSITDV